MGTAKQQGFGLVEILIALGLGVVIILGVTTLYANSSRSLDDVARSTRLTETAAYAMDVITADLQLAGFWAERIDDASETTVRIDQVTWTEQRDADASTVSGFVSGGALDQAPPCACLGTGVAASCELVTALTSPVAKVERSYKESAAVELVRGMMYPISAGGGSLLNGESGSGRCGKFDAADAAAADSSDYVAIRRASTCPVGVGSCQGVETGVNYLQIQGGDSVTAANGATVRARGDLIMSTNTAAGGPLVATMADGNPSPIYRYISRIYYVGADDTLNRLYLTAPTVDGDRYLIETIAQGVEALRFEWHVDTSGDGFADEVTTSPLINQWPDIVGATVWMIVRSPQAERGYTDESTYSLPAPGPVFDIPDGFESHRRAVFSKTVEMANIAGRRRVY